MKKGMTVFLCLIIFFTHLSSANNILNHNINIGSEKNAQPVFQDSDRQREIGDINNYITHFSSVYSIPKRLLQLIAFTKSRYHQRKNFVSALIDHGIGIMRIEVIDENALYERMLLGRKIRNPNFIMGEYESTSPFVIDVYEENVDIERLKSDIKYNLDIACRKILLDKWRRGNIQLPDNSRASWDSIFKGLISNDLIEYDDTLIPSDYLFEPFSGIYLNVPLFRQRHENQWSTDLMNGSCNIAGYGCFICSQTMVMDYYQENITNPKEYNNWLNLNDGYKNGCNYVANKAKEFLETKGYYDFVETNAGLGTPAANWDDIDGQLSQGHPVIIQTNWADSHFIVIVGKNTLTGDYYMNDPYNYNEQLFSYYPNIGKNFTGRAMFLSRNSGSAISDPICDRSSRYGSISYWKGELGIENETINRTFYYTTATAAIVQDNYAKWFYFKLPSSGMYEVQAFIPGKIENRSQRANYIIHHTDENNATLNDSVLINQNAFNNQWVPLGNPFYFHSNDLESFVQLNDNTGEDYLLGRKVVFDAIRFISCDNAPFLKVLPNSRNVVFSSGTTTFDISNIGTGTMNWTGEVTEGGSWLSIQSGGSGTNTGSITASFNANMTTSNRTGTIRITAPGATGSPKYVIVTQAGISTQPILTVTPENRSVTSSAGTTTFDVSNTGTGDMNWTAEIVSGTSWLIIKSGSAGTNGGIITVEYSSNTESFTRAGSIIVKAPGASGSPVELTVFQQSNVFGCRDLAWAKNYGINTGGTFNGIQQTGDGGFIACGAIYENSINDIWIVKTNCQGEIEWQRSLGKNGGSFAKSIIETKDGGFTVLGARNGGQDIWILGLSKIGEIVWQRNYGGQYEDGANSIIQTDDGGYIIAGYSFSFGNFTESALVFKINPTGDIQWQKIYEGGTAFSIKQVQSGGYILLGRTNSPTIYIWVMKLTDSGDIEWQKGYDGGNNDWGYSIDIAEDGGLIIGGITGHPGVTGCDYLVMKIKSTGNFEWGYSYGGNDEDWAYSGKMTKDGGYVLAGSTHLGGGNNAVSVLKISKNGDIQWQKSYNLATGSLARDIQQTGSGDFVLAGAANYGNIDNAVILLLSPAGEISSSCGFIANTNYSRRTEVRTPIATSFSAQNTSPTSSASTESAFDTNSVSSIICQAPQNIKVTSPDGGENWVAGSTHNITWTAAGIIANVKIESSTDSGLNYTPIVVSTANNGSYAWTLPNTPSATSLVRVSDASNAATNDVSDAVFSIVAGLSPTLLVASPNGGESWLLGSAHNITWTSTGTIDNVMIEYSINSGTDWTTIIASTPNDGSNPWIIPSTLSTACLVRVSDAANAAVNDVSNAVFTITTPVMQKDDLLGTWAVQGVYYRNSDSGGWIQIATPASKITAGDLDGDGIADLIGIWPSQGGVWAKYSKTGTWAYLSSTADWIAAADMNGDGRAELLGSWTGQGVFWRNNTTGAWTQMATPATKITAGDLDGDGIADLIGIWPSQGGVWVKYSQSGTWAYLSSTADWIAAGDMNGDGRADLLGAWTGQGVYYRNSITGQWVQMATPATMITTGDLDGDGKSDLIGIWPSQGGVWVKYSQSGTWAYLSSTADWIATGKMRAANGQTLGTREERPLPIGGLSFVARKK